MSHVHSRVDSNTFTMGVTFIPPVRDFRFGVCDGRARILGCFGESIMYDFYALFLTRVRIYKIA
jgi:hypothetical protein